MAKNVCKAFCRILDVYGSDWVLKFRLATFLTWNGCTRWRVSGKRRIHDILQAKIPREDEKADLRYSGIDVVSPVDRIRLLNCPPNGLKIVLLFALFEVVAFTTLAGVEYVSVRNLNKTECLSRRGCRH